MAFQGAIIDKAMLIWDFRERHHIIICARTDSTYRAMRSVTSGELAPAYELLFSLRFIPDRLYGQEGPRFEADIPPMDHLLSDGPLPFSLLRGE